MTGKASYALAHVVFRGHQVLHLSSEQFVGPVQFLLQVSEGLKLSGERQHTGLFLTSFGLGTVALLGVTGRDGLLLGQHLKNRTTSIVDQNLLSCSNYFQIDLFVVIHLNQWLSSFLTRSTIIEGQRDFSSN